MPRYELFLDGSCHLCNWEGRWLRRHDIRNLFEIKNISEPLPDSSDLPSSDKLQSKFHLREIATGQWITGVDAFIVIYREIPKLKWLGNFLSLPGVHFFARIGYSVFARIRVYLPKRKDCRI